VIASAGNTLSPVTAYTSLTDHTLPITSLALSFGKFPRLKLLSSSLDGSCKIWDLSLKTTPLLSTFSFAGLGTTRVTNITWDTLERSFYAALAFPSTTQDGKEKSGRVVKVDLYRQVRENEAMPVDGDDEDEDEDKDGNDGMDAEAAGTRRYVALAGGGRGDITQVSEKDATALGRYFSTPSDYISSLQFSTLSSHLIVGTQAGKVHILSLPSMQVIRTIVPSQTSSISSLASPITYLRSMIRPVDLITRTGTSSGTIGGNKTNEAELLPRPVAAQLSRTLLQPNSKEAEERTVNIRLTGNGVSKSPFAIDDIILPAGSRRNNTRRTGGSQGLVPSSIAGAGAASAVNTQALQEENARLREQLARSIAFNDRMWESVVDTTLAKAKEGKSVQGETKTNGMHVD
jgi:pre-rRNA-processing protein IPI3